MPFPALRKRRVSASFSTFSAPWSRGKHEITIYTSCCSAQRGIYYYTTYENRRISAVDMHRCNLDAAALVRFAPRTEEDVFYQN